MLVEIVWWREALDDLDQAHEWYESQGAGLGSDLAEDLDAHLKTLRTFPRSRPVVFKDLRRVILRRFPFGVYYLVQETRVVVVAILHLKRDLPTLLSRRLRSRRIQ